MKKYFDTKVCFRCGKVPDYEGEGFQSGHFHKGVGKGQKVYTASWCSEKCMNALKCTSCRKYESGCYGSFSLSKEKLHQKK